MDSVVQQDRVNMTGAEWQVRCDLAALYRICDLYGWTDTINTHLSVRIPGEPKCFLINNYGDLFHDSSFTSAIGITLIYTVAAVAAEMVLGLAIALLLNVDLPWIGVFRTALVVPMMITLCVIGIVYGALVAMMQPDMK